MGGGGGPQATSQQLLIRPDLMTDLQGGNEQLKNSTFQFQDSANNAANKMRTGFMDFNPTLNNNFSQHNPNLNTNFTGPNFGTGLDAFSQNVVSQGQAAIANQRAAQNAQIARQFAGNPGVGNILKQQGAAQAQLAGNPLLFQASANQRAREGQEYQLNQQAQSLTNATRLAQGQEMSRLQQLGNQTKLQGSEFGAGLQAMGNAALGQQLATQGAGVQAQQNLMSVLSGLAALTGKQIGTPEGQGKGGIISGPLKYISPSYWAGQGMEGLTGSDWLSQLSVPSVGKQYGY